VEADSERGVTREDAEMTDGEAVRRAIAAGGAAPRRPGTQRRRRAAPAGTAAGSGGAESSKSDGKRSRGDMMRDAMDAQSRRETLRFYSEDAPGLKIAPTMVIFMSAAFIFVVLSMHILGKMFGTTA